MKTLMRNGRDRRSENPRWATRRKSACFCLGPISGSHQGQRPNGRTQRPDTWLHPNASLIVRFLLHRGRSSDSSCTAGAVHTWPNSEVAEGTRHFRFLGLSRHALRGVPRTVRDPERTRRRKREMIQMRGGGFVVPFDRERPLWRTNAPGRARSCLRFSSLYPSLRW
jgi:hypothetical protein